MAIQSNFPAIKPSLNLDFANTEALDPRITFTRASTATYYDGVTTAKAEENLLLRSQDYSATWTVTNLTPVTGKTAPDTTSTATEFTATAANAVLTQGFTAIAGSYTFSVFLRRVTGSGDIQIAADNGTWTTKVITGTWARYDVTQTVAAGSKTAGVRVVTDTDAIEVWGAQLEQRDAVTSYTATTTQQITNYIPVLLTAATNAPRFDHNPTTGESLGLLIEEQRTNLFPYSEDFADAAWSKTRSSITSNTIVAPDGTLTGDKLVEDTTATSTHFVSDNVNLIANTFYTATVYVKAAERTRVLLQNSSTANWTTVGVAYFDLSAGTIVSGTGSITPIGNGWYRCSINGTFGGTDALGGLNIFIVESGTTISYTGDGYSGIYIWGAQLEAGAFPMSYIATVAATATRSADAASMTGTNFSSWYNQGEGALYVELVPSALAAANGIVVNDNTTSNRIRLATTSTSDQCTITATGTAQAVLDGGTPVANTTMKLAMAYQVNNFALSLGGASVATDTAGVTPIVTQLQIGAETTAVGNVRINKMVSKRKTATRSPTSTTSISSAQSTNPRAGPLKPTKAPCRRWLPLMAGMLTCGCYTTPIQVRLTRTLFPLKRL
jgi:hypothetical protein